MKQATMDPWLTEVIRTYHHSNYVHFSHSKEELQKLADLAITLRHPRDWWAFWIIDIIQRQQPNAVAFLTDKIAAVFPDTTCNSNRRMFTKFLKETPIKEQYHARIINTSFEWLMTKKLPVATRVNCLSLLVKLAKTHPAMINEIESSIELLSMEPKVPAMVSRLKSERKILEKIKWDL